MEDKIDLQKTQALKEIYEADLTLNEKLQRLQNNPDFRDIILNGFCRDDCALYMTRATNLNLFKEDRESALEYAKAGGCLTNYLKFIENKALIAKQNLPEVIKVLDEAMLND